MADSIDGYPAAAGRRRMVQIYLPRVLREQMLEFQVQQHLSNAELVLKSILDTHEQLEPIIAAEYAIRPGGLFSHDYRPRSDGGSVQLGVRLKDSDIATIDGFVSAAQARSRSAYIVTALKTFLSDCRTPPDPANSE